MWKINKTNIETPISEIISQRPIIDIIIDIYIIKIINEISINELFIEIPINEKIKETDIILYEYKLILKKKFKIKILIKTIFYFIIYKNGK